MNPLKTFDPEYFEDYDIECPGFEDITHSLATYLFDNAINDGLYEEHWEILTKIRKMFGDPVAWEVIRKLCYREHDT